MGLSYEDGYVSSDSAFEGLWGRTIRPLLQALEEGALEADLMMRLCYASHPAAGDAFLVETSGEGRLSALMKPERYARTVKWGAECADQSDFVAEDILVRAAQDSFGRTWMLNARYRRVVREAYRYMIWHAHQPMMCGNMLRRPLDLDGQGRTVSLAQLATCSEVQALFARWFAAAVEEDDERRGETHRRRPDDKEPRFVYSQAQAQITLIRRAQKWLVDARAICLATAPEIPRTETSFLKLEDEPEAGMINGDTGETHPAGFPVIRNVEPGVDFIPLSLPTLELVTMATFEIDQAASEDHLEFKARNREHAWRNPDGPPPLRKLLMRSLGDHHPTLYENWLRLGASMLEEPAVFVIDGVDPDQRETNPTTPRQSQTARNPSEDGVLRP